MTGRKGQQGARPWGGLVPPGVEPHVPPQGPSAAAGGADAAPPVPQPVSAEDRTLALAQSIDARLAMLCDYGADDPPPELLPIVFDAGAEPKRINVRDDHTQEAASYGLYNPSEVPVFVAFSGGEPTAAGGAFPVPSPGWMVVPMLVGTVMLGADREALEALESEQITVWRIRFPTYQAFDMGRL